LWQGFQNVMWYFLSHGRLNTTTRKSLRNENFLVAFSHVCWNPYNMWVLLIGFGFFTFSNLYRSYLPNEARAASTNLQWNINKNWDWIFDLPLFNCSYHEVHVCWFLLFYTCSLFDLHATTHQSNRGCPIEKSNQITPACLRVWFDMLNGKRWELHPYTRVESTT
jgi:hypothetical protein